MPNTREQLFASTFWNIRRPKHPLTPGHFVIRLNDPSLAFGPESATDFLRCYGQLRRALTELMDASGAQLYISRNWQPVGDAIGEPLAETSTPSLHTFFVWPGSPTAASALLRPAHRRSRHKSSAPEDTDALDDRVRICLTSSAGARPEAGPLAHDDESAQSASTPATEQPVGPTVSAPEGWGNRAFQVEPAKANPGDEFSAGHWTAVPRSPISSLDQLEPAALLELTQGIEDLAWHSSPRHAGMSVWATDLWGTSPRIDIFAREHGDGNQLASFLSAGGLELSLPPESVKTSSHSSPTVER